MSDDDTDRWRKPKRAQTSDDRALSSRRDRSLKPHGVPIVVPPQTRFDPDVTSPFEMLERQPGAEARAIVQRSRRTSGEPATVEDLAEFFVAFHREKSASRQRERETEVVLQGPHKAQRSTRRHLIAAVIAAGASIGGAVKQWSGDAVRVQQLEKAIDRLDTELREIRGVLGHRSELEPASKETT